MESWILALYDNSQNTSSHKSIISIGLVDFWEISLLSRFSQNWKEGKGNTYSNEWIICAVKLGIKELLNKEQTGVKEHFTDYQPFFTINLLLNKELGISYLSIREHEIMKISKKEGTLELLKLILLT